MKTQVEWQNYPEKGHYIEEIYSLDDSTIDEVLPGRYPNGNYRIIRYNPLKEVYKVIYIGRVADRVSDSVLPDRLKEHIGEWSGILFFDYEVKNTPLQAYYQECRDYHNWQPMYNSVHPAKLPGRNDECPICRE